MDSTRMPRHAARGGFTLIELLVVVMIIGVLVALIIPAAQSAREAGRRIQCLNNLKQIGLATHEYLSIYSVFPSGMDGKSFSAHVTLLPYLDQVSTYNSLNFVLGNGRATMENLTVESLKFSVFLCPSDPEPSAFQGVGRTSYPACSGDGIFDPRSTTNGLFPYGMTPNNLSMHRTVGEVLDGTSATVAFSEWLVAGRGKDRRRDVYEVGDASRTPLPPDLYAERCRGADEGRVTRRQKGLEWTLGVEFASVYNHAMGPQQPSCSGTHPGLLFLAPSAGSLHPGGVNVLFADSHASFVKDSISPANWKAISTAAGGEISSSAN